MWDWVEEPLILSNFVRTFIWPVFLFFVACMISITGIILLDLRGNVGVFLAVAALSIVFALLLFIPYFDLRVEHMVRLYEMAVKKNQTRAYKIRITSNSSLPFVDAFSSLGVNR